MAPKRTPASQSTSTSSSSSQQPPARSSQSFKTNTSASSSSFSKNQSAQEILLGVWNNYLKSTPQRVKLIDVFMAFLVVVGGLQFVYCVVAGNYVSGVYLPLTMTVGWGTGWYRRFPCVKGFFCKSWKRL